MRHCWVLVLAVVVLITKLSLGCSPPPGAPAGPFFYTWPGFPLPSQVLQTTTSHPEVLVGVLTLWEHEPDEEWSKPVLQNVTIDKVSGLVSEGWPEGVVLTEPPQKLEDPSGGYKMEMNGTVVILSNTTAQVTFPLSVPPGYQILSDDELTGPFFFVPEDEESIWVFYAATLECAEGTTEPPCDTCNGVCTDNFVAVVDLVLSSVQYQSFFANRGVALLDPGPSNSIRNVWDGIQVLNLGMMDSCGGTGYLYYGGGAAMQAAMEAIRFDPGLLTALDPEEDGLVSWTITQTEEFRNGTRSIQEFVLRKFDMVSGESLLAVPLDLSQVGGIVAAEPVPGTESPNTTPLPATTTASPTTMPFTLPTPAPTSTQRTDGTESPQATRSLPPIPTQAPVGSSTGVSSGLPPGMITSAPVVPAGMITSAPLQLPGMVTSAPVQLPGMITSAPVQLPRTITSTPVQLPRMITTAPVLPPEMITTAPVLPPEMITTAPVLSPTDTPQESQSIPPISVAPVSLPFMPPTQGPSTPSIGVTSGLPPGMVTSAPVAVIPNGPPALGETPSLQPAAIPLTDPVSMAPVPGVPGFFPLGTPVTLPPVMTASPIVLVAPVVSPVQRVEPGPTFGPATMGSPPVTTASPIEPPTFPPFLAQPPPLPTAPVPPPNTFPFPTISLSFTQPVPPLSSSVEMVDPGSLPPAFSPVLWGPSSWTTDITENLVESSEVQPFVVPTIWTADASPPTRPPAPVIVYNPSRLIAPSVTTAAPVEAIESSEQSVECSARPGCQDLMEPGSDCCPTVLGFHFSCCGEEPIKVCEQNPMCEAMGLTSGSCCPTPEGLYLDCCSVLPDECADSSSILCQFMPTDDYRRQLDESMRGSMTAQSVQPSRGFRGTSPFLWSASTFGLLMILH